MDVHEGVSLDVLHVFDTQTHWFDLILDLLKSEDAVRDGVTTTNDR